jgi:hypothetical protein
MRVPHIIAGMLGLVSLAITAPTRQFIAVQPVVAVESTQLATRSPGCTTVEPEKWLITICGNHTTANAVPKDSFGVCLKLTGEVQHEVVSTAHQQGDTICRFYDDSDWCNSERIFTTAGPPTQVPTLMGKRIMYVKCEKAWQRRDTGELKASVVELAPGKMAMQHDPGLSHAREEDASSDVVIHTAGDLDGGYATHMYAGIKVASIEDRALDQCYTLPNEVTKQVTWIELPQGYVCKYYRRCDCHDNDVLLALDSWPVRLTILIESILGTQIEYAMCKKSFDKRDLPVATEDPRDSKLRTLRWGQLRIGEDNGHTKLRKVINALEPCVVFPAPMYPDSTRFLEQSGRSECSYYAKTECAGDRILHTLNPDEKDLELGSDSAQQINAATCTMLESISTASLQARGKPLPHVNVKDIKVTVGHSISASSTPFLKVGDLYICNVNSLDPAGCTVLHTLNQCVAFPPAFAYQSKVITQAKGSFCKYYTKPGCMDGDEYFRYMSNPTQDAQFSGWGVEKLAGVWCGGTGAAADVNTIDITSNDITNEKRDTDVSTGGNPFYHWDTSSGATTVCHKKNFAFCTNNSINAIWQCANFAPADQGPVSLIQYEGVFCKWYRDFGCESGSDKYPSILDSRKGDAYADNLLDGDHPRLYKSVKCEIVRW